MSVQQDNAFAATAAADNLTSLANASMTSVLHFQANQAHGLAANAWSSIGTVAAKQVYHNNLAAVHLAIAIQLRANGK
jgi:predicted DCC family thiol-disulfide oxidoreductase YuxK